MSNDSDRKKPFSLLEKDLFLNIIQKHENILSCKQTNATSAYKKKTTWETIKKEFNTSSIVTQQIMNIYIWVAYIIRKHGIYLHQLIKLWYNMKAKARESKTKENIRYLTGGGPAVVDMDAIDAKVMDIDKNILTNIAVDIDSDVDGSVIIIGDNNNEAWNKQNDVVVKEIKEPEPIITATPRKIRNTGERTNQVDYFKCKILEEELEYKRKLHDEELKTKIMEREYNEKILSIELEYKEKILKVELEIKNKMLSALDK